MEKKNNSIKVIKNGSIMLININGQVITNVTDMEISITPGMLKMNLEITELGDFDLEVI